MAQRNHIGRTYLRMYLSLLWLALLGPQTCRCQSIQDTQDVITFIMTGYNKDIRPSIDQSNPVEVQLSFELVALREFVEINEKLSTVGILNMNWVDSRMRWDPAMYNNTMFVTVPMDKVWKPQLILSNNINAVNAIGHGNTWMVVRYHFSGAAFWNPGDILDSSCAVDVTFYPYDVQKCRLDFIPWGYLPSEVFLSSKMDVAGIAFFDENGEWSLNNATTSALLVVNAFSIFRVDVEIERRPLFFLINVVLPIIFMGFLNVLVFALPAASGERVSYAITVLLAIAVFLTIVGDNMPKTSRPMSAISYFLLISLVLSACICLGTIISLIIYHRNEKIPVPKPITWLTRKIVCKSAPKTTPIEEITQTLELSDVDISPKESEMRTTWAHKVDTLEDEDCTTHQISWIDVSRALDRVFGVTAFMWLIAASVGFIVLVGTRDARLASKMEE